MLAPPESPSAVLVMISRSVSICNRVNNGKIAISLGYPFRCPHSSGISSPGLKSVPERDTKTGGRTDRVAIASTRLALRAVVREKRFRGIAAVMVIKIPPGARRTRPIITITFRHEVSRSLI